MKKSLVKKGEFKRARKESPEDIANSAEDTFKEKAKFISVEEELEKQGIQMFSNDSIDADYLRLPPFLDEEQSNELGRYLHTFTQQKMWTRTLLGRVGAMLREKEEEFAPLKESIFASCEKRASVTEKELKLFSSPVAKAKLEEISYLQEKYNMLSLYMENLVDGIFDISREISRREGDFKDNVRTDNVNRKRR